MDHKMSIAWQVLHASPSQAIHRPKANDSITDVLLRVKFAGDIEADDLKAVVAALERMSPT
jgi:hypothetical protein